TTCLKRVSSPGPAELGSRLAITRGLAMAFNLFRAFRKHQKVFMAGMVFVAMITFVLAGSSGVFQEVTGWFGGGGAGTPVANLYGKPVYAQEINQVRQQRDLANFFLINAISASNNAVCERLKNEVTKSKLSKETQGQLGQQLVMRPFYLSRQFGGGQS